MKAFRPNPKRLMLRILPENLPLLRQVVREAKASLSPVECYVNPGARKPPRRANAAYLNMLSLDRSSMAAEALFAALPDALRKEKVTVYLSASEFISFLTLLKKKALSIDTGKNKWYTLWCQLRLAGKVYKKQYGK